MTRTTRARFNWRALAPLALAATLAAGITMAGMSVAATRAPADPPPTPVTVTDLYGKWDGTLTVDGRPYCLAEWPCYDALIDPAFAG